MSRRFALYLGGFLGPFGTIVTVPMLPELRDEFSVSTEVAGLNITMYVLPMAALMVFSGTLGERWGRNRTVRLTAAGYAGASLICALAPSFGWFLFGRALQGMLNAFFTPLLVAALAETTPSELLGRAVGFYSSFQAVGTAAAPLVGGLAADAEWRSAFVVAAAVALSIAIFAPPEAGRVATSPPSLRPLFTRPINLLGFGFMAGSIGPLGAGILVGLAARDELGLDGRTTGMILLIAGLGAALTGPLMGGRMDRLGGRRGVAIGLAGAIVGNLVLAGVFDTNGAVLATAWLATWVIANLSVVSFHAIGAGAIENNRGGGLSMMLAYRFAGVGLSQIIWLPVFTRNPSLAFAGAAAVGLVAIAASWASRLDTLPG
ncbi:MAG: MFS transporter [Actinomycetia bacterium]|nr:MFS transporter [Actinomycetes bacterium]